MVLRCVAQEHIAREAGIGAGEGLHRVELRVAHQPAISVREAPQSDGQERERRTARRALGDEFERGRMRRALRPEVVKGLAHQRVNSGVGRPRGWSSFMSADIIKL